MDCKECMHYNVCFRVMKYSPEADERKFCTNYGKKVKVGRPPILTDDERKWAYEKWCEGYSIQEIAEALYVDYQTVRRLFNGKKKDKPKLVYERGKNEKK